MRRLQLQMLMQRDKDILRYLEDNKAISIKQATKIFFKNSYGGARRRLADLEKMKLLKSYENVLTNEKIYYIEERLSAHDLYIMDFYAELVGSGATIRQFKKQPRYLNDMIRGDGFFEFVYDNNLYFLILEVDLTHFTSNSKMQLYEKLYKDNVLQEECRGMFPSIVIMKEKDDLRYMSNNFEVVYIDFQLNNFTSKIF